MMDQTGRGMLAFDGHVEGVQGDLGVQSLAHGPAHDLAGVQVEDGGEIEPLLSGLDTVVGPEGLEPPTRPL